MSILNIYVDGGRALVAVDTKAGNEGSSEATKVAALAHFDAGLAVRGQLMMLGRCIEAMNQPLFRDFDDLVDQAPKVIGLVYESLGRILERLKVDMSKFEKQEVALVGWSEKRQQMVGHLWARDDMGVGFRQLPVIDEPYKFELGSWLYDEQGPAEMPASTSAMERVVRQQVQFAKAKWPDACPVGGRLMIAELRRNRVAISSVCDLESEPARTGC